MLESVTGGISRWVSKWRPLMLFVLGSIPFLGLADVVVLKSFYAFLDLFGVIALYFVWSIYAVRTDSRWQSTFSVTHLLVALTACLAIDLYLRWIPRTVTDVFLTVAVVLFFVYYWVIVLLSVRQKYKRRSDTVDVPPSESVSVLIPAYNEEGYIQRTIQAVLDTDYPGGEKEIIVIDDGSTDDTYQEALAYSDEVKVVTKENGGKHSALNYGLVFATGDVIVTIDADSIVHRDALKRLVHRFEDGPDVGAVASRVDVVNGEAGLVARCQQLEYIVGMNVYRRMLDLFGVVTIVPGCLGAFRREVIEEVLAYDGDTLTEDFDLTAKVLKAGYEVHVSDAVVSTEVPDTWRDLYNQRLRWFRGNIMTLVKHSEMVRDTKYDLVSRLAFPMMVVEMFFIPLASWIILYAIALMLLNGLFLKVALLATIYVTVIVLISMLALDLEETDWMLGLYSPLLVVGYKHFLDVVMLKSIVDVFSDRDLDWTSASRIDQREKQKQQET